MCKFSASQINLTWWFHCTLKLHELPLKKAFKFKLFLMNFSNFRIQTFLKQIWTISSIQRWRIEAAEMKLLRPMAGYTLYDHKTNDYICCELRITGVLDKIYEYRWNWLSHLQRMPQNQIHLKSYHYRPQGRRTIGRSKKRWREQL